jgi:hypothetical protein
MKRLLMYLTLIAVAFALPAFAQNESVMDVHVDKTVAIPGNILRPGNYVFRLFDLTSTPGVVGVYSAHYNKFYGYIQVSTAYRSSDNGSQIKETAPDSTGLARIKSWFFPGQQEGYRFNYSKADIHKEDMVAQNMRSKGSVSGM